MTRTLRTLLLSATALGALATAAAATPSTPPPLDGAMTGMTAMHTAMSDEPDVHDAMLEAPAMQAHMSEYSLDADQMRQWHETGTSVARMHEALAEQGIDVDAMQADCPMLTDASMSMMHRNGGHHDTPGGERS